MKELIDQALKFTQEYSSRSGIDVTEYDLVALPCDCGEEICKGWAMIGIENVDDHVALSSPAWLTKDKAAELIQQQKNAWQNREATT